MLLYAAEGETAFSLNDSARAIWELCDGQRTVADLCRELGERFACEESQLLSDVTRTVAQLQQLGLLEHEVTSSS
jgi:coenzyme PQQ biosynthesis protein PqqD